MNRQPGYYHAKPNQCNDWTIGYYRERGGWSIPFYDSDDMSDFEDSYFAEINENRILSPDEYTAKNLSEVEKRFKDGLWLFDHEIWLPELTEEYARRLQEIVNGLLGNKSAANHLEAMIKLIGKKLYYSKLNIVTDKYVFAGILQMPEAPVYLYTKK